MLVINNIEVGQNEDGLYSLTDIWKSSGNMAKRPVNFKETKMFTDLSESLKVRYPTFKISTNKSGRYGGTWGCKEIVYAYAMYIDASFLIKVIDAFDALVMGELATALKIANNSAIINKVGEEFDRLTKDDQAVGEKAMNDFCNASGIYNTYSCKAGEDLASCRGKKKKRSDAEKAITERSQLSLTI